MNPKLKQALSVSEQDVKDASAGILKDLKRFQTEKEEDLKRYMVCFSHLHCLDMMLIFVFRSRMLDAILTGRRRTSRLGKKRKTRWIR